jgi:hypothetical protein
MNDQVIEFNCLVSYVEIINAPQQGSPGSKIAIGVRRN